MLNQDQAHNPNQYECGTLRQHFNHLRNNSSTMRNILSWNQSDPQKSIHRQEPIYINQPQKAQKIDQDHSPKQKRNVSFDSNPKPSKNNNTTHDNNHQKSTKISTNHQNPNKSFNERPKSSGSAAKPSKQQAQDIKIRTRIRERQQQEEAQRQVERRQKVKQYIEDLKPYTRSLTNTKYQQFFDKAALQSYGRNNLKNAAGGIIYGNHQKTFNVNPHTKGNEPKYYQTHQTAINYGKRTKLSQENKWNRLEKQLTKKLGLKDKNESLKQGKQVVYVDVDEQNIYSVMKQNQQFKKKNDQKIRQLQKSYADDIQKQKKAAVEQFYANKRDRIMSNNTIDSQLSTYVNPRDDKQRLQEQVIYRQTDKNGVVRYGADRHAMTCFVDMNFPENDAAYTQELINRSPIYPIEVQNKDRHIDDQRRGNYIKSQSNIYPSHYLLPNCDQPQVIKMINTKYGQSSPAQYTRTKGLASTIGTINQNNSSFQPIEH